MQKSLSLVTQSCKVKLKLVSCVKVNYYARGDECWDS